MGNGGTDYGDCYFGGLYWDYYRDPFPHSLLRTRQSCASACGRVVEEQGRPKAPYTFIVDTSGLEGSLYRHCTA